MSLIFISGSSTGLGMMVAHQLADQGHDVVLHARSAGRAQDALGELPKAKGIVVGDVETIAGATEVGLRADRNRTVDLRAGGIVATPEDLGVRRTEARRTLLAARSIDDLVAWSGGLYHPPAKFRSW